jgi:hypothetical protein
MQLTGFEYNIEYQTIYIFLVAWYIRKISKILAIRFNEHLIHQINLLQVSQIIGEKKMQYDL